jgi:hypothetical protein
MKFLGIILASVMALSPVMANAQEVPSYAQATGDQAIKGRIVSFDGTYNLEVRDDAGYVDNVQMHQGTIINPTGITLEPGMVVNIYGYPDNSVFEANEIDTPYTLYNGGWYYEGHPWTYYNDDWAAFGFGFFFGSLGWWHHGYYGGWHGSYYHGGYGGYHGGYHGYVNSIHVNNYNRVQNYHAAPSHVGGGSFHGGGGGFHGGSHHH